MTTSTCQRLRARIAEVLDRSLEEPELASLRTHGERCEPCAGVLRSHGALVDALSSLPKEPGLDIPVPALPAGRVIPLRTKVAAAAVAAALLSAVAVGMVQSSLSTADLLCEMAGTPIRVDRVVDAAESPDAPDEELLALTVGWEAVASRRPAVTR